MKLSDIGEFGLINHFSPPFTKNLPGNYLGIGDDCAVIPWDNDHSLLITTDMLIEDIHFLRSRISPQDLGYKSLAVNLSDIAAMGGTPDSAYLSVAIPKDIEVEWLNGFFEGLYGLGRAENTFLLGGDTTRSPGPFTINIVVLGRMKTADIKYRSAARAGDEICVTGWLGNSGGGLTVLQENRDQDEDASFLLREHHRPRAHVKEGQWLAAQKGVHAMMDVSDGIDSDLRRIMERSRCGASINLEKLPLSPQLLRTSEKYHWDVYELAASGGEDYCLLVTVEPDHVTNISADFQKQFDRPLYAIGSIIDQAAKLVYSLKGKELALGKHGFDHFK